MIRRTAGLACLVFWLYAGVSLMSCDTAPAPAPEKVLQQVTLASPKSSLLGYTLFVGLEKEPEEIGIRRFVMKPVIPGDLAIIVRQILDKGGAEAV